MEQTAKKKWRVPNVYIIIMLIALACALLTFVLPAGSYERIVNEQGRKIVDPASFSYVESSPVGLFAYFQSFYKGLVDASSIVFFVFIIGGAFAVVEATGAIEAGLGKLTRALAGREKVIIPVAMLAFALGGATFGMSEEIIPFVPIMVALSVSMGMDSLVGAATVLCGSAVGFAGAFLNPFTIGVAQGIAGLPIASGLGFRLIMLAAFYVVTVAYLLIYAGKIQKDKTKSPMYELDMQREDKMDLTNLPPMTKSHVVVLLIVLGAIVTFMYGVIKLDWYLAEMTAVFMIMGVLAAAVGRLGLNGFAEHLGKGMMNIAGGALIIGFARAILIILSDGLIIDTILHAAAQWLSTMHTGVGVTGMYIFQCFLNFLVPSGSGQAAVSMPIMAPLADLLGITRQTAVVAFQMGDALSNVFTPTSGFFMAGLALGKVPWAKWAKWFLPLLLIQYALGLVIVLIANAINLGPF